MKKRLKLLLWMLLFSFASQQISAQTKELKTRLYDTPEDSIATVKLNTEMQALTEIQKVKLKDFQDKSPDVNIRVDYAGLFYLNSDEAVYNMRFAYARNFTPELHNFSLKMDFFDLNGAVVKSIIEQYDTVDCGSFIIRIHKITNLKNILVSYIDRNGKTAILDQRAIAYSQNELLDVSEDFYNKSSLYSSTNAISKALKFADFMSQNIHSGNIFEGLVYTQNQFNIYPPIEMTGSLGGILASNGSSETISSSSASAINPCDTAFISKWVNSMKKLYGFSNIPYYQIVRCLESDKYNLDQFFDDYVRSIMPEWQGWKKTCYRGRLKSGEMECDCQRVVPIGNLVRSGSRFAKGYHSWDADKNHEYRAALSHINGQRNPAATWKDEGSWGDPDCRAVLQGFTWGPANWLHLRSNGGCCDQNGLHINYGDSLYTAATPGGNSPLFARMRLNYSCLDEQGWFPDDCKCPLDLHAKFYLESTMTAATNSNWDCTWSSRAQAKVENMGLALIMNEYQSSNPGNLIWSSNRAKVSSETKSNFNPGFIFDGIKTLGNILVDISKNAGGSLANWGAIAQSVGTNINNWINNNTFPSTSQTPQQVKNAVLVDKTVRWSLEANVPVVMQISNFVDMFAGGEDGFNSNAWLNSGFAMDFYIQPDKPNPNNPSDMYCCHEFTGAWIQHNDCSPNSSSYAPMVVSHLNGSNSSYILPPMASDNHMNHLTTKINNCSNFRLKYTKSAPALSKENKDMLTYRDNKIYWNLANVENAEVVVSDILGKVLEGKKLHLTTNDEVTDLSKYDQRMVIITVYANGQFSKMKIQL